MHPSPGWSELLELHTLLVWFGDVRRSLISLDSGTRYAGGGMRFRASKAFDLDVSLDLTLNDKEESHVCVCVGQSF